MPLTGDYSWTERNESVTVKIPLKGVSPAKVDIFVTSKLLKVNYAPYLVEVLLHGAINEKKHKAMVKDGVLNMILLKVEPGKWGQLAEGGVDNKDAFQQKKKDAMLEHEKVEVLSAEERKERRLKDEKFALRKQMAIDSEERDRLDRVKAEEKRTEEAAMYETFAKLSHEEEVKKAIEEAKKKEKGGASQRRKVVVVSAAAQAAAAAAVVGVVVVAAAVVKVSSEAMKCLWRRI